MALVDPAETARRDAFVAIVRESAPGTFNKRFADWLLDHWDLWCDFERAGQAVQNQGFQEYSAYVIVNVVRWRANVRGARFSMSNTLIPDLARLYNATHKPLFTTSTRFGKETTHG